MKSFWTGSAPVEFESAFDLAESVDRLRAATKRSSFSVLGHEAAVGTVKEARVSLQRVIPMVGNSFKPVFVGRFEEAGGKVVLRGAFGVRTTVKIFMAVWFGVLTFGAAGFLASTIHGDSPTAWMGLCVLLGMIVFGLALIKTGQWFSRNDPAWLSQVIGSALGAPGGEGPVRPPKRFGVPVHLLIFAGLVVVEGVLHLLSAVTDIEMFGLKTASSPRYLSVLSGSLMLVWAYGICRLHRLAWWAGLTALAYWAYSLFQMDSQPLPSLDDMAVDTQPVQTIFIVVGLLLLGLMGRWWYSQRVHFRN